MGLVQIVKQFTKYITEGFVEIFSPDHDDYPKVGLQPFEGEPYQQ
jgi:hypothetical protein